MLAVALARAPEARLVFVSPEGCKVYELADGVTKTLVCPEGFSGGVER